MKKFSNAGEMAREMKVSPAVIEQTFKQYNEAAASKNDSFGRKFFDHAPLRMDDALHVAIVTPVVHYCMGGLRMTPASEVVSTNGTPISGLFAAGEVMGGTHGQNRLGGSSLLDCVVFGRVAGQTATAYQLRQLSLGQTGPSNAPGAGSGAPISIQVDPATGSVRIEISQSKGLALAPSRLASGPSTPPPTPASSSSPSATPQPSSSTPGPKPTVNAQKTVYTWTEVAKHNKESDCWVVVNGQVLNVTNFLPDHPGGKKAVLLFAGKDATEEFNMLHKPEVVQKYAPEAIIGTIEKGPAPHKTFAKL